MVRHDLPTPPPPTTTNLYSLKNLFPRVSSYSPIECVAVGTFEAIAAMEVRSGETLVQRLKTWRPLVATALWSCRGCERERAVSLDEKEGNRSVRENQVGFSTDRSDG